MRKIKEAVIFIIIFLIILLMDFGLYKNLDKLMPTYENRLYSFENEKQEKSKEFLFEMYEQVEIQNSYRRYKKIDQEEIQKINENKVLFNIIREYVFAYVDDEEYKELVEDTLYISKLSNTIYGDFKILSNIYTNSDFMILYSEDMHKIYYININAIFYEEDVYKLDIAYESFGILYEEEKESIVDYTKKGKDELVKEVQELLFKVFKNYEFNPDIIIYKGSYYILKDNKKDMTVCYNANNNTILGLYMGFEK